MDIWSELAILFLFSFFFLGIADGLVCKICMHFIHLLSIWGRGHNKIIVSLSVCVANTYIFPILFISSYVL